MDEFYGSEDEFTTYAELRGYTIPSGDVEPALIRASNWLDGAYRGRLPGVKVGGRSQWLEWPRRDAYDVSGELIDQETVPDEWLAAVFESTLREMETPGSLSPDVTIGSVKKSVSISGAVSVTYADEGGVVASQRPILTIVDDLLSGIVATSSHSTTGLVFLQRA